MTPKPLEHDDPFALVGAEIPATAGEAEVCSEEMARTFVEEYVRLGWTADRLLRVFRDPFYRGPYAIYRALGDAFVRQLIAESVSERRAAGGA